VSGHSKWSTIKRKKQAQDQKRGKVFTRLIREITVAAKEGGGDPESNPRLRTAIDNAQTQNMPKENIKRAIQRGTGELPGVVFEEHLYEGYGPGGVAILVETVTDNNNRTTAEVRHVFEKRGGHLAKSGAASYSFDRRGLIILDGSTDEDLLMEVALESGALDIVEESDAFEVLTEVGDYHTVNEALTRAGFKIIESSVAYVPQNLISLESDDGEKVVGILAGLEDLDDVQNVYTNFDIPEDADIEA
jgi:YebC/PmpR family DNA-binding regulatory protein